MSAPTAPRQLEQRVLTVCRVLADVLAVSAGFLVSGVFYIWLIRRGWIDQSVPSLAPYSGIAIVFSAFCLLVFWYLGLYERRASVLNLWELRTAIKGVLLASALFIAALFFLKLSSFSRLWVISAIPATTFLIIFERRLLSSALGRLQASGRVGRRVLIYGCGSTGRLLMKKIVQAPHLGCTVIGFLDDSAIVGSAVCCRLSQTGPVLFQAPVLGRWRDWTDVVATKRVDELLVTAASVDSDRLRELLQFSRNHGLKIGIVPHLEDLRPDQLEVEELSAISVLRPHTPSHTRFYLAGKRMLDVILALGLLLLTFPLWLAAGLLIRLDSPGPIFFLQERVGLDGRRFRMFKFRTMRLEADPYAPSPVGDIDPRITRIGRLLRMGGMDELPQLINVLRGEMSLVGPRPEMPFIVEGYSPLERQRLRAKPGITGLWQLSADRHAEIHENIEYDLYYVSHQSLVMDLLVLVETLFFTGGVLLKASMRIGSSQFRWNSEPAVLPSDPRGATEAYVLVALDQRRAIARPESWRKCVPAACAVADRWLVKVLVASGNLAVFDQLLEESLRQLGTRQLRAEFVDDRGRFELRSLVRGARLVVTDLPHIETWANEGDIDLLAIRGEDVHWTIRSRPAADIVTEFGDALRKGRQSDVDADFCWDAPSHIAG